MAMVMTLSDLTERLAKISPENPATLTRQLRHWTDNGSLPLTGDLYTGTGRGRDPRAEQRERPQATSARHNGATTARAAGRFVA